MKMKRNLIIFGVVLVLAVGLVIVAPKLKPAPEPTGTPAATQDLAELTLGSYNSDQVSELTVTNNNTGASYTVVKQGTNFVVKGMEDREFDQTSLGSLALNAAGITADRLIEKDAKDLSAYGLDKPQAMAAAKYNDGATATFLLGSKTPAGNTYYMMKQGDTKVFTVWMNVGDSYLATADSYLAKQKLQLTKDDVGYVKVVKQGQVAVELSTSGTASTVGISPWTIEQPWKRAVDTTALDTYLTSLTSLAMDSVVDGNATDLAKYGLDKPAYDLTISGKGKTDEILVGGKNGDYNTYAMFAGKPVVYSISTTSLDFLKTSAYALMDKMIVLVNISNATGVEFNGLGQQGTLDIEQKPSVGDDGKQKLDGNGNPMYDQVFTIAGKPVEDKVARYYYQTCIGLQTHSLIKEGWQPAGNPVATLTYHRNTEPKTIVIEFMAYDKDFYAVRMEGNTYFLIKQDRVQQVADDLKKLKAGELTVQQ